MYGVKCGYIGGIACLARLSRDKQWIDEFQGPMKKALGEMQTLRAGCSKAEPKNFAPTKTPLPGDVGPPKFNQLGMVITCTYRPILVKIDVRNFELSW